MPGNKVILNDACVLLNLLATGRIEEILGAFDCSFGIVAEVAAETLYLKNPSDGTKDRVDIQPLVDNGILFTTSVETPAEESSFVHYAALLDDGEAMSLAIATERNWLLATDDRKTRNLIERDHLRIGPITTVQLLQCWQSRRAIDDESMSNVLNRIWERASYNPKPSTDEGQWWFSLGGG